MHNQTLSSNTTNNVCTCNRECLHKHHIIHLHKPSTNNTNTTQNTIQANNTPEMVNLSLKPEFKIIKRFAQRYPPLIMGTINNSGLGKGTVLVTADVYYADKDIKQGEELLCFYPIEERDWI